MHHLLVSEEQLNTSLCELSCANPGLAPDPNGNLPYAGGIGGIHSHAHNADGRETGVTMGLMPATAREGHRAGLVEEWSSHLNNNNINTNSSNSNNNTHRAAPFTVVAAADTRVDEGQPTSTSHINRKRLRSTSPDDNDINFNISEAKTAGVTFQVVESAPPPPGGGSLNLERFDVPRTSLVLTSPRPVPAVGDEGATYRQAVAMAGPGGARGHYSVLVPHQAASTATAPFWYPMTPAAARTLRSIETDDHDRLVPDMRNIASGALVDIEIPASFAGSAVSITGSQTTLLSSVSPYKYASVRRSFSADSLFTGVPTSGVVVPSGSGECSSALVALSECQRPEVKSPFSVAPAMKRASSLEQLRVVSPYPVPSLSCFVHAKTEELVQSLSVEERASLALSLGDEPICRICWQGSDAEDLVQPCYCSTHVHTSCVQRWLSVAKITYCEVCRYQYRAYRKMKPLAEWRWWPHKNRHLAQLEATLILLGVVTPPLLCGIILCSQKIGEYLKTTSNAWKTAGLMTLVMVSVGTYLGALLYFCHKFATVCKVWANCNRTTVVTVVPLTQAQRRPRLNNNSCPVWSIS